MGGEGGSGLLCCIASSINFCYQFFRLEGLAAAVQTQKAPQSPRKNEYKPKAAARQYWLLIFREIRQRPWTSPARNLLPWNTGGVSLLRPNSRSQRSQEQLINLITRGVATCTFQTELISSIFKSVPESTLRPFLRVYIYVQGMYNPFLCFRIVLSFPYRFAGTRRLKTYRILISGCKLCLGCDIARDRIYAISKVARKLKQKFSRGGKVSSLWRSIYMGGGLMRVKVIDLCKCYLRRLLSLGEGRRKIGFGLLFLEFKRDSSHDFLF